MPDGIPEYYCTTTAIILSFFSFFLGGWMDGWKGVRRPEKVAIIVSAAHQNHYLNIFMSDRQMDGR